VNENKNVKTTFIYEFNRQYKLRLNWVFATPCRKLCGLQQYVFLRETPIFAKSSAHMRIHSDFTQSALHNFLVRIWWVVPNNFFFH